MTTRQFALRSIGCSVGLGAGWGVVATVAVLFMMEPADFIGFVGTSLIGSVFGGAIGAVVGFVVGVPTALLVHPLRSDLPHCRRAGPVLATAGVGCVSLLIGGLELFAVFVVLVPPIGFSAWFGLGWIFRPAVQHAS